MTVAGRRTVAGFAALGAISGSLTTGLLMTLPERWKIEIGDLLFLSPLSIVAGLVFGVIFGAYLGHLGLANRRTSMLYAAAATLSYCLAVNLAFHLSNRTDSVWLIGVLAGLLGGGLLTAAAAGLLPDARRARPAALMIGAGGVLGALLEIPLLDGAGFWHWLALFAPWQAGYAAAFAAALPAAVER